MTDRRINIGWIDDGRLPSEQPGVAWTPSGGEIVDSDDDPLGLESIGSLAVRELGTAEQAAGSQRSLLASAIMIGQAEVDGIDPFTLFNEPDFGERWDQALSQADENS